MSADIINQIKRLKNKVEYILANYPQSRNSDTVLTSLLWQVFYPTIVQGATSQGQFVYLNDLHKLPSAVSIVRIRLLIQNTEKRYPPTDWEVAKKRKWRQEEWTNFMRS